MILRTNDVLANPLLRYVFGGAAIAQIDVILQSSWPESGIDCSWPAMGSMKEGRTGSLSDDLDTVLGLPILMVSVDCTEGHGLISILDGSMELLGSKDSMVTVIVFKLDIMARGKSLEGFLCYNCINS